MQGQLYRLHEGLGARLVYSSRVGFTGADAMRLDVPLPGPKAAFFFAPQRILKRREDWGVGADRLGVARA